MIYLRQELFNPVGEGYQNSNIAPVGQPQTHYKPSRIDKPHFSRENIDCLPITNLSILTKMFDMY